MERTAHPGELAPGQPEYSKSKSVALPVSLWDRLDADFGDNRSAFFKKLVADYYAGKGTISARQPLSDLAAAVNPGLTERITRLLHAVGVSQPRLASALLLALDRCLVALGDKAALDPSALGAERRMRDLERVFDDAADQLVGEWHTRASAPGSIMLNEPVPSPAYVSTKKQPSALARRREQARSQHRGGTASAGAL